MDADDASRRAAEQYFLATARWKVRSLSSVGDALALLATRAFDAILVGLHLGDASPDGGLRVAELARAARQSTKIVVFGADGATEEQLARARSIANAVVPRSQPLPSVEHVLRRVAHH